MAQKWKGKDASDVIGHKPEQVWLLLEDFFGLDKWFPTMTTCLPVQGTSGQVGCVRFCAGFQTPVDKPGQTRVNWTKEKLVSKDPGEMSIGISMFDGTLGFKNYRSEMKVVEKEGGGCEVEWVYEVDPVEGWTAEDVAALVNTAVKGMGKKMETALGEYNEICSN